MKTAAASNTATLTLNLTGAANLLTTCTNDIVYEYDSGSYIYGGTGTNNWSTASLKTKRNIFNYFIRCFKCK